LLRKTYALIALLLGVLLLGASPAGAVTGNYTQDFAHPYVGLVVFYDANGDFAGRCSGSLISPSVVLTAGHCVEGVSSARVYFEQDAGVHLDLTTGVDPVTGYPETGGVHASHLYNYGFNDFVGFPDTHDIGLVALDQPIGQTKYASTVTRFAKLATAGSLDQLAKQRGQQDVTFTVSGYGLSYKLPHDRFVSFRERLMATEQLIGLNSALTDGFNVKTSANPGNDRGGTCNGDSGGPLLYSTTDVVTAVDSFGINDICRGTDYQYRVDRTPVIDFILSHVPAGETVQFSSL
jgi:secreted trypsin-like serine protease